MFIAHPRIVALLCLLLASVPASALIMVGRGNAPVSDQNWRAGSVDAANLKTRVGWWEGPPFGGGMWNFLYRGDTEAFNAALAVFAKVRAPALELIVRDGPAESTFLRDDKDPASSTRYDWDLVIWNVQSYYHLYGNPNSNFMSDDPNFRHPLPPPRMTIYIGGGGSVDWGKVAVPKGIRILDQRASAAGIKPGSGAVIVGNVFDMATSKPLPGATITIDRSSPQGKYEPIASGAAGDDGCFSIEKVPAGVYRIWASAKGYAPVVLAYEKVSADGYRAFDDVELSPEAAISGTVVDDGGKPIAGASVRADDTIGLSGMGYRRPETAQVTTDEQGKFQITGLPGGYARPACFAKGYYAGLGQLITTPAPNISIRMTRTGTIKGKVISPDGKPPTMQAIVECNPEGERLGKWGGSMQVQPDGTFQFDNVPPATYIISARPNPGPAAKPANETTITVTAGKTAEVELKL